jgi:hypothetical protein
MLLKLIILVIKCFKICNRGRDRGNLIQIVDIFKNISKPFGAILSRFKILLTSSIQNKVYGEKAFIFGIAEAIGAAENQAELAQ